MAIADVNREVGRRIAARRRALGLSQERLAAKARMDRTAIGKIERAERGLTVATLLRLARALGTSPSRLLEGLQ